MYDLNQSEHSIWRDLDQWEVSTLIILLPGPRRRWANPVEARLLQALWEHLLQHWVGQWQHQDTGGQRQHRHGPAEYHHQSSLLTRSPTNSAFPRPCHNRDFNSLINSNLRAFKLPLYLILILTFKYFLYFLVLEVAWWNVRTYLIKSIGRQAFARYKW